MRVNCCYRALPLFLVALLAGCFGGTELTYHLIDPRAEGPLPGADGSLRLEVLDVRVPAYLDRNPVVSRDRHGQLRRSDSHQWGDSLRHNLVRTTVRDLSTLLDSSHVTSSREQAGGTPDYRLLVSVEEFERGADGSVVLDARWQLTTAAGEVIRDRVRLQQSEVTAGIPGQVNAMERLYGQLVLLLAEAALEHAGYGNSPS